MQHREAILQQLRDDQIKLISIEHQKDGIVKLFDAAAVMANGALAELYRQQLHDLLDIQLDTKISTFSLTRKLLDRQA